MEYKLEYQQNRRDWEKKKRIGEIGMGIRSIFSKWENVKEKS